MDDYKMGFLLLYNAITDALRTLAVQDISTTREILSNAQKRWTRYISRKTNRPVCQRSTGLQASGTDREGPPRKFFYSALSSPVASLKAFISASRSSACRCTASQVFSVSYQRAFSSSTVRPCCSTQV